MPPNRRTVTGRSARMRSASRSGRRPGPRASTARGRSLVARAGHRGPREAARDSGRRTRSTPKRRRQPRERGASASDPPRRRPAAACSRSDTRRHPSRGGPDLRRIGSKMSRDRADPRHRTGRAGGGSPSPRQRGRGGGRPRSECDARDRGYQGSDHAQRGGKIRLRSTRAGDWAPARSRRSSSSERSARPSLNHGRL